MSDVHAVAFDSTVLTVFRTILSYACNKYLLQSIYQDLESLTSTGVSNPSSNLTRSVSGDPSSIELDSISALPQALPVPNTSRGTVRQLSSLHPLISRAVFSLCFSESCTLFLLFLCQEIGVFNARSRLINWNISLSLLLLITLLIVPLLQNILLTYESPLGRLSRRRSLSTRIIAALIPYSLYLFAFSLIPLPKNLTSTSWFSTTLSRLVVLGTFIMGILSGLGAARNAWDHMPLLARKKRRIPSVDEVNAAEEALNRIRKDIQDRRDAKAQEASPSGTPSTWISRVTSTLSGNSGSAALRRELDGLIALEYQMDRNLEILREERTQANYNLTLKGQVFKWSGRSFALYCVFRTLSSMLNIFMPLHTNKNVEGEQMRSYPDIIAHLLTYALTMLPSVTLSQDEISAVSRQISLGFVGVIILSSVRFTLKAVSRLLRLTSQALGASLLLLILAQLMGTYLISTLVQIRTAFPPSLATLDVESTSVNIFSTLPAYEVFGSAFDYSYLLSAFGTIAYLWIDDRINNGGID